MSLIESARTLANAASALRFSPPVSHVYNPLSYAWPMHELYLRRYGQGHKRVIFLGMNPGPFGMVQTGIPFGEIGAVRTYLKLEAPISKPAQESPKRPIEGLACTRSEVSGARLWALFSSRFAQAGDFFETHFVANYCPLAFLDGARNVTPDKLPKPERLALDAVCDAHLRDMAEQMRAEWVIGVGKYARKQAELALGHIKGLKFGDILHPSPASPAANRGWAPQATRQLQDMGLWG